MMEEESPAGAHADGEAENDGPSGEECTWSALRITWEPSPIVDADVEAGWVMPTMWLPAIPCESRACIPKTPPSTTNNSRGPAPFRGRRCGCAGDVIV